MLQSILDNDLYKFTMQNAVITYYPRAEVKYDFINRGKTEFPEGFAPALQQAVNDMAKLQLSAEEKKFLQTKCTYLSPAYVDFLAGYRYSPAEVSISQQGGDLRVNIEGYWYRTILWEVPLMAIISELYFKLSGQQAAPMEQVKATAMAKAERYKNISATVAEFGTRRRFSFEVQNAVVEQISKFGQNTIPGSSNVLLAMRHNLSTIGTHAHEWFMYHGAQYGYQMANEVALEKWADMYQGQLGFALSDTFTTDVFFRTFNKRLAAMYDGVRHDSGDPLPFADKTIAHYEAVGIDPLSKTIIFTDGLYPDMVEKICLHCTGRVKFSFGVGTNFSNDVGVKPLNIVIKITQARPYQQAWIDTVKLSDVAGKHTGAATAVEFCKRSLGIRHSETA